MSDKKSVLFVCMGNICRSPAAEGVFKKRMEQNGLDGQVRVESAGTLDYHEGEPPDPRMITAALRRGYPLESEARQVRPEDFEKFDLVVAMDRENLRYLRALDLRNRHSRKIKLFCDFIEDSPHRDVPDPFFGGEEGFEQVLDMLEEGCDHILEFLLNGKTD